MWQVAVLETRSGGGVIEVKNEVVDGYSDGGLYCMRPND
jgi:hypothetical protein